ncbi:TRAP transporter permease [Alloyangia pacifica]|uniref:TRAP transporter, 4TM/12TM fusion protein n=1 Tax=Alloyangia pacifica TaxID=311180 RepID=A0A1I6V0I3_9RHOB|nr:TRAP transporter fused permease subunit [Alloyangia pacifica]SDI33452.1 TRAP transporter, 4TM/12TM fusion protein [Alloyangia pacifica]SFT07241.1 TRAP transporter, 4TM/12TM fusion protein [Alloyangia pacifica]
MDQQGFQSIRRWLGFDAETMQQLRAHVYPAEQGRPEGLIGLIVAVACAGLAIFTLYAAFAIPMGPTRLAAAHLGVAVPLIMLIYPRFGRDGNTPGAIDIALAVVTGISYFWAFYSAYRFQVRMAYYDPVETIDLVMGIIAILGICEATRRTIGWSIVVLAAFFVIYALTGPYWPGILSHRGTEFNRLIEHLYILSDGIFNFVTGITATFLFTFMMFGTFLRASKADNVFTDLAMSIAGGKRGGPAKVAVISSALMGMLSGSTISNVATTGAMTIPLMKRGGFSPKEAGAIESVASLGGAITPPLMGSGIFLMVAFSGVPLTTLLAYSVAPAILYYIGLYVYVGIKARKRGLEGLPADELPNFWQVLRMGGHIFIPVAILITLLLMGYTAFYASAACVVLTLVVGAMRVGTRLKPGEIWVALEASTRVVLTLTALSASAALVYGVMTKTGLIVKVSSIILSVSGGSLFVAIILVGLMSYILGMGLPVTAAYVLISALSSSALVDLGTSILVAHMIIFWFSQDSTITPPIGMTAFVAARVAGASPMATGMEAVKLAKALYILPFAFAYSDLMSGNLWQVFVDALPLAVMFSILPTVFEGYALKRLGLLERLAMLVATVLLFFGSVADPLWLEALSSLAGIAVAALVLFNQKRQLDTAQALPAHAT